MMPIRTELEVLEADDIHFLRVYLSHLLMLGLTSTKLEDIYAELKKEVIVKTVMDT